MTDPRIETLTDQQAITALRLVLERERRLPDTAQLDDLNAQVSEAAGQPVDLDDTTELARAQDDAQLTQGALAREALTYLAAQQPDQAATIARAIAITTDPLAPPSRIEPITMGAGLLVVLALQTDLRIERGPNGKWHFKIHKKALSNNALTTLLAKLIATYTGGAGT